LGGSRNGGLRTYLNLTIVFLLCGFWHGANWTFGVWGGYHGLFLVVERLLGLRLYDTDRIHIFRRLVTLIVVICGWVIFRCNDLDQAGGFYAAMFTFSSQALPGALTELFDLKNTLLMLLSGTVLILPPVAMDTDSHWLRRRPVAAAVGVMLFMLLLPWCLAVMASGFQNPFIYYRF
jgi:alginate O-acetyltransferase complex protein AlgI